MRELPGEAATSVDMQIRDARSRLAWTLAYIIIPFLTLIPFVIEAIFYIFQINPTSNSGAKVVSFRYFFVLIFCSKFNQDFEIYYIL